MTHTARVTLGGRGAVLLETSSRAERFAAAAALRAAGLTPRFDEGRIEVASHQVARLREGVDGMALRWTPDAEHDLDGRELASIGTSAVAQAIRQLATGGPELASTMLRDVDLLSSLDPHQVVNVAAMTVPGGHGLCLFDEQGAGKTVSVIAAFDVLVQRDQADFMLVLAPKAMLAEWRRDIERFTDGVYRVAVYAGTERERRASVGCRPDVLVANYEAAVNDKARLQAVVGKHARRGVLTVDESFVVKNAATSRSRAAMDLRRLMGRTFVLCGTPAPNRADDVVAQVSLLDFGLTFDTVKIPDDRTEAVAVVRAALDVRPTYIRNLKADVLPDLPGRTFTRVPVQLAPQQQALYASAESELVEELRHTDDDAFVRSLTSWSARRSALLRLCSNPVGLVDGYREAPAKLAALDRLLDEHVDARGEKVVIWSWYTASLSAIAERYAHLGLVRYDGTVTGVDERAQTVRSFQEDPGVRIFVGNPGAAGAGLTLHAARIAIYESLSNQAAHYLQSLDRIHRRGQTAEVEYYFLVAEDTIESAEYDRLSSKHEAARDLLGDDDPWPVTRRRLLADLVRS